MAPPPVQHPPGEPFRNRIGTRAAPPRPQQQLSCHPPCVTEDEIVELVARMPGVATLVASEANGAPEIAWGDSFFFYDPDGNIPADRRLPFATIVIKDYEGFDEASRLNRPDVFRLNIAVGRARFEALVGYPPAQHVERQEQIDYSVLDTVMPHPLYATQAWVSIINPSAASSAHVRSLVEEAHRRAEARYRP